MRYSQWLISLTYGLLEEEGYGSYGSLCRYLHSREFYYEIDGDERRAEDGIDFRTRYSYVSEYSIDDIEYALDSMKCSVLEMMVALAFRCEEQIMKDQEVGDRVAVWIFSMLRSLKIDGMEDGCFDKAFVEEAITNFLNHDYSPDGNGGLFYVPEHRGDFRETEIWYQMHQYLHRYY